MPPNSGDPNLNQVDMSAKKATAEGKRGKSRPVYFGRTTARTLWQYLREDERAPQDPLFQSHRGERITRNELHQLIERIGDAAGIETVRCSPHTFRHTMAITFFRAGLTLGDAARKARLCVPYLRRVERSGDCSFVGAVSVEEDWAAVRGRASG